ncbi:maleylpyruvate isomerase family mycothiol-dependent enzyme [Kitasatospora aureofaciens]|uniref:maleylpyruvate isomerase family mycothiol-dependent enzyme n=1 Tax=Kitasatospora aureofaciens TaxID=1894 RepID=UPI00069191C9|nr:maleylpyruvate isomerase family mycothiol-dependent enzyme [Kitasatospora aureofaciens]HJD82868.1 maleylpyruvate isomerase family mycothiol-dependent enzyme [Kitasatospora aureofaciens]
MNSVQQEQGAGWIREQIAAERRELAGVFAGLTAEQWNSPSLCEGWRVREVVAHMSTGFRHSTARTLGELVRSGGNVHRMADRIARRDAAALTEDRLAAALAEHAEHPWRPPVGGRIAALAHDAVHGLDVTVALGLGARLPLPRAAALLGTVSARSLRFFGARLEGVRLRATDLDWSYGQGPLPVEGRAEHLLLVAYGRRVPAGLLSGAGAERFTR